MKDVVLKIICYILNALIVLLRSFRFVLFLFTLFGVGVP